MVSSVALDHLNDKGVIHVQGVVTKASAYLGVVSNNSAGVMHLLAHLLAVLGHDVLALLDVGGVHDGVVLLVALLVVLGGVLGAAVLLVVSVLIVTSTGSSQSSGNTSSSKNKSQHDDD